MKSTENKNALCVKIPAEIDERFPSIQFVKSKIIQNQTPLPPLANSLPSKTVKHLYMHRNKKSQLGGSRFREYKMMKRRADTFCFCACTGV